MGRRRRRRTGVQKDDNDVVVLSLLLGVVVVVVVDLAVIFFFWTTNESTRRQREGARILNDGKKRNLSRGGDDRNFTWGACAVRAFKVTSVCQKYQKQLGLSIE